MAEATLDLLHALKAIGRESLTLLWGPLVLWTVVAALVLAGLYLWRGAHPLVHYRARQALLFALPAGVVAALAVDPVSLIMGSGAASVEEASASGLIVISQGAAEGAGAPVSGPSLTLMHGLGLATLLAGIAALLQVVRLGRQALALRYLPETLSATPSVDAQGKAEDLARTLGITRPVRLLVTPQVTPPMTFGARNPTVIVPEAVAQCEKDLRLTLLHELTHIRRRDYLWSGMERLVAALFAIHPGVGWLRHRIDLHREMACDAAVLRETPNRRSYADLLYRLTELSLPPRAAAVSLAQEPSSLKERIQTMTRLTDLRDHPTTLAIAAAAFVLIFGGSVVACSDMVGVDDEAADDPVEAVETEATDADHPAIDDDGVYLVVEEDPELMGGMEALIEEIEYPDFAQEQSIEGTVFVEFIVDENGQVREPEVTRGVHVQLDEEARRAVGEMEFEPGVQNGEPVPVRMALPVRFQLPDSE